MPPVDCQRVGPGFRGHNLPPAHGANVDDIDDAGIADGYIESPELSVQEHNVRCAAQGDISKHTPGARVDGDENSSIASTQKPTGSHIEFQPMGSFGGDFVAVVDSRWVSSVQRDNQRWGGNVDKERPALGVIDGPACSARHFYLCYPLPVRDIDHGDRVRIWN
jgi:hypothetical protein